MKISIFSHRIVSDHNAEQWSRKPDFWGCYPKGCRFESYLRSHKSSIYGSCQPNLPHPPSGRIGVAGRPRYHGFAMRTTLWSRVMHLRSVTLPQTARRIFPEPQRYLFPAKYQGMNTVEGYPAFKTITEAGGDIWTDWRAPAFGCDIIKHHVDFNDGAIPIR